MFSFLFFGVFLASLTILSLSSMLGLNAIRSGTSLIVMFVMLYKCYTIVNVQNSPVIDSLWHLHRWHDPEPPGAPSTNRKTGEKLKSCRLGVKREADRQAHVSTAGLSALMNCSSVIESANPSTLAIPEGAAELSRLMTSVSRYQHFSSLLRGELF
jgi:hypothetical protein